MDNLEANISNEEQYQLQSKHPDEASKKNTIIHEKQNEKNGQENDDEVHQDDSDSDENSINLEDQSEYVKIDVDVARRLVTCKECGGILRKTKALRSCLHRFCGECIDKWLAEGNVVCPICDIGCLMEKPTLEDANFDNIVAAFRSQLENFEAQPSELPKEERACNDQPLIDGKFMQAMTNTSSSTSQPLPSSSQPAPLHTDEMLDRIGRPVAAAILKHRKEEDVQPPSTCSKESSN